MDANHLLPRQPDYSTLITKGRTMHSCRGIFFFNSPPDDLSSVAEEVICESLVVASTMFLIYFSDGYHPLGLKYPGSSFLEPVVMGQRV